MNGFDASTTSDPGSTAAPSTERNSGDRTIPADGFGGYASGAPEQLRAQIDLRPGNRVKDFSEWHTIGLGGMGEVCEVREHGLNRNVALKILRPRYRGDRASIDRFVNEARVTAQIGHPNIVPVYQLGIFEDEGVYFTMKRVEGRTLRTILEKMASGDTRYLRRYTLNRLVEIFIAVCNGVAAAHKAGFIHCDLKPANIMVGTFGEVMVMDWGVARHPGEQLCDGSGNVLSPGGTPAYMAPEHITKQCTEPDARTDVYGLGCLLYSILTWKVAPFDLALPTEKLLPLVAAGKFPPPHRCHQAGQPVPRELEAICLKAMALDRGERYPTVRALLEDVRNYVDEYPVSAYSPNIWYRSWKGLTRHPLIPVAICTAIFVAVLVFGLIWLRDYNRAESLRALAGYNFTRGEESRLRFNRRLLFLEGLDPHASSEKRREVEREIGDSMLDALNSYSAALDLISRLSNRSRSSWRTSTGSIIFKHILQTHLQCRNLPMTERLLHKARSQWELLFRDALAADPELATLVCRVDDQCGVAVIAARTPGDWRYSLLDQGGRVIQLNGEALQDRPFRDAPEAMELPAGTYRMICSGSGGSFELPLTVDLGLVRVFRIPLPAFLPSGMAYVPAGSYEQPEDLSRNLPLKQYVPGFLMAQKEVTFGEYFAFWFSLPEKERAYYTPCIVPSPGSPLLPLWDANGIFVFGISADLPLFGVGPEEAAAFCRWLSKKTGRRVRLPSRREWEKAFHGTDARLYPWGNTYRREWALLADHRESYSPFYGMPGGSFAHDRSPYGIYDLCGSVRELLAPQFPGAEVQVIGGSRLLSRRQLGVENFYPGAADVGFRYVMEL